MSVMVLFTGCGLVQFDVDQPLPEQRIEGNVLGGLLPEFLPNPLKVSIDVKAETQKRGTGPATAAYLKSLTFNATRSSGTFAFLDEVHIFIEAPNLPKREVARALPMGSGGTSLPFEMMPNENLLPFVNAGATLSATVSGHPPAKDFTFDGALVLDIRI